MSSKPKPPGKSTSSNPRALVLAGPRHVQTTSRSKRDANGLLPTTSRALVLRKSKLGAVGSGELVLASKITGREKLDLLAEDLVLQKSRSAVMSLLKLDTCIRIADSQYNAYLDDIVALKDPDLFCDKMKDEIAARTPNSDTNGIDHLLSNALYIASVVTTRIHNLYMIASGWKIVLDTLRGLAKSGLKESTAHAQFQQDQGLCARYLALCDITNILVDLAQVHFSVLATTAPHYSRYFKPTENVAQGEPEMAFDWGGLKDACRSFLDSIIIELCFPRAPYPKRILLEILHDAVDESPHEARRFPQGMWDAVGDLSVTLELQELLETPLLRPKGEELKALPRKMPERYERWLDAQIYSKQASELHDSLVDMINPLEMTRDRSVLDQMWKAIDSSYTSVSEVSIDTLWQFDDVLNRKPQWSAVYSPDLITLSYESESEDFMSFLGKRRLRKSKAKKIPKNLRAITDGKPEEHDSDGSMPPLQSVSDLSDETNGGSDSTDDDDLEEEDGSDDETQYDSEDDEINRNLLREAMDAALAIPEFFDPKANTAEFEALVQEKKANPFMKLLGSLRGRVFTSNAKLSATTRTEPRKGIFGAKSQAAKEAGRVAPAFEVDFSGVREDDLPPLQPLATPRVKRVAKPIVAEPTPMEPITTTSTPAPLAPPSPPVLPSTRATVEDAEDEDDIAPMPTKKKKKKKKKPKKERGEDDDAEEGYSQTHPAVFSTGQGLGVSMSSLGASMGVEHAPGASTASLAIEPPTTTATTARAMSGHAYLQEVGVQKEKIKSRPDNASLFSEKRGFFSKLGGKDKDKDWEEEMDKSKDRDKGKDKSKAADAGVSKTYVWFSNLGKKTAGYMGQLLRTGDEKQGALKWEHFLKVMRDMGFSYDPSTAGSSVRFDPPNKSDRSITFHKPHPNTTLHAHKLRDFSKRLKAYYGWSEEEFLARVAHVNLNENTSV